MQDSTKEHKLTTWEAYNYILRGLVNEAIDVFKLDPEVKLTTLQIWSSYLRRNEAAFFNDEEEVLPKLPACFKKHDFNLLSNKRKQKHSETNEEEDPHFTKFDLQIAKIDKKMLKVDQEMALSQSMVLKRIDRNKLSKRYDKQKLSRGVLFLILFCAINYHHPSMVQTSDILRMIREGRLSYFRCRHFLPPDLSESEKTYIHKMYVRYPAYMSVSLFNKSLHQFTFFCNLELKHPNLYVLIERYITELGLPPTIYTFVEKLFSLSPSEFEQSENRDSNVPYYEARAMAYILFALKLLFGVNGVTEVAMSKSAKAFNTFLEEHGVKCPKVFVWSEWVEYLTARKLLLMKYYEQNHLQYDNEYSDYSNRTTEHVLNLHERLLDKDYGRKVSEIDQNGTKNLRIGLRREIGLAKVTKRMAESKGESTPIMQFPPSLTPDTTNLEVLMTNDSISVPSLLREDYRQRDIEYLIKSSKLKRKFHKCGFQLKTVEAPANTSITFNQRSKSESKMGNFKKVHEKFVLLETNISTDNFQKELEAESHHNLLEQMKVRNDPQVKQELTNLKQYMKEVMKKKRESYNPKSDDLFDEIETSSDSDAAEGDTTTITIHRPNFDYWTYLDYPHYLTQEVYDYMSTDFPLSFKWLLENCATLTGMSSLILYFELVAVETQFLYILKPMYEVEKEVVHQDVKRLRSGMSSLVRNLGKKFKSGQWN